MDDIPVFFPHIEIFTYNSDMLLVYGRISLNSNYKQDNTILNKFNLTMTIIIWNLRVYFSFNTHGHFVKSVYTPIVKGVFVVYRKIETRPPYLFFTHVNSQLFTQFKHHYPSVTAFICIP